MSKYSFRLGFAMVKERSEVIEDWQWIKTSCHVEQVNI